MRALVKRFLVAAVCLAPAMPALASTIWLHPQLARQQGTNISIRPSNGTGPTIDVTSAVTGDFQWINIPVFVSSDVDINSVTLCYRLSSSASYVSQIRILETNAPPTSFIQLDDPTDLTSTAGECATSQSTVLPVTGTITILLRLNFANTTDVITIGGMGLNVSPITTAATAPGQPASLQLRPNRPNPLRSATTIEYEVPGEDHVEVTIFDVAGKRVRSLVNERQGTGSYRTLWDRRDDAGHQLAAGAYFYQVRMGTGASGTRKMVVLP